MGDAAIYKVMDIKDIKWEIKLIPGDLIIKGPIVIKVDTQDKLIEDIKKYKEDSDNVQYFISRLL